MRDHPNTPDPTAPPQAADPLHPAHYTFAGATYEPLKVIRAWGLGFNLGNVAKYIARAGRKDTAKRLEDLKKGREYLDDEIKHLEQLCA